MIEQKNHAVKEKVVENSGYPKFRWFLLLIAAISFVSLYINLVAFAPILDKIAVSLNVSPGTATQLMTISLFSGSLSLLIGGFLCDRFGIIALLIVGNIFGSVSSLIMPWLDGFTAVFWARFFQGFAVGFCTAIMSPMMAIWFPLKERGIAAGIGSAAFAIGGGLGAIISPIIYAATGNSWQHMAAWLSVIGWVALILACIAAVLPKTVPPLMQAGGTAQENDAGPFKQALSKPTAWIGLAVAFLAAWCMHSVYNVSPTYLAVSPQGLGLGPITAGQIASSVGIAAIFAPIIGGIFQDRVFKANAKPLMYIGFALTAVFIYLLLLPFVYTSHANLAIALGLAGAGFAIVYPALAIYISTEYPVSIVGKMFGLWFGLGGFGGATGIFLAGLTVNRFGSYGQALTLIALAALAGFVLLFFLPRTKQQSTAHI